MVDQQVSLLFQDILESPAAMVSIVALPGKTDATTCLILSGINYGIGDLSTSSTSAIWSVTSKVRDPSCLRPDKTGLLGPGSIAEGHTYLGGGES